MFIEALNDAMSQ